MAAAEQDGTALQRLGGGALRRTGAWLGGLPRERLLGAGAAIGAGWARMRGPRVDVALRNLRIAYPEWSESRRRRLVVRAFENLGRVAAEVVTLGALGPDELAELVDVEGEDRLEAARAATPGGGVIAITAHLDCWELLGAAMAARGLPLSIVARPRDNPSVDAVLTEWRAKSGADLLARGSAARGALRALRDGRVLALPLDQNCAINEGVFVPFFGRLACTRDGPARIAMRTGVPVLPVFIRRLADGVRHRIRIGAPVELAEGSGTDVVLENVRRLHAPVEEAIRSCPEQWTWNHRRWRTHPPGEPRPYPSRGAPLKFMA